MSDHNQAAIPAEYYPRYSAMIAAGKSWDEAREICREDAIKAARALGGSVTPIATAPVSAVVPARPAPVAQQAAAVAAPKIHTQAEIDAMWAEARRLRAIADGYTARREAGAVAPTQSAQDYDLDRRFGLLPAATAVETTGALQSFGVVPKAASGHTQPASTEEAAKLDAAFGLNTKATGVVVKNGIQVFGVPVESYK